MNRRAQPLAYLGMAPDGLLAEVETGWGDTCSPGAASFGSSGRPF